MNYTVSYEECDGEHYNYPFLYYSTCCDGDACNHKDGFDISECEESCEWSAIWKSYSQCIHDKNSAWYEYECNDAVTEITCEGLDVLYMHDYDAVVNNMPDFIILLVMKQRSYYKNKLILKWRNIMHGWIHLDVIILCYIVI